MNHFGEVDLDETQVWSFSTEQVHATDHDLTGRIPNDSHDCDNPSAGIYTLQHTGRQDVIAKPTPLLHTSREVHHSLCPPYIALYCAH